VTYVIAEIGSCFDSKEDCLEAIYFAKAAGADAIKFQCFDEFSLYGMAKEGFTAKGISEFWLHDLSVHARDVGIDFGVTFFEPEQLLRHEKKLDYIKIASSDLEYAALVKVASRITLATEKPLYISTGGHTLREVAAVAAYVKATFLYCESAYPASTIDLKRVRDLELTIKERVGLSDHTKGVGETCCANDIYEFPVIEKHVNFFGYTDKPDSPHSCTSAEFAYLCENVKERVRGPLITKDEMDMRRYHNRRVVAIRDIEEGEEFDLSNIGFYRGQDGVENYCNSMEMVYGKTALKSFTRGQTITI